MTLLYKPKMKMENKGKHSILMLENFETTFIPDIYGTVFLVVQVPLFDTCGQNSCS